ncbi:hypothetical protein [Streptomyces sp. NBRC 109706]|uniref:hypothetical protein n=1 Tax=Streptomyces sp. NBRC 109706 TaxID=1550035 RepID=UPI00078245B3|nr:hypothetical protein [Streptomyces sp. NBRC 109706]
MTERSVVEHALTVYYDSAEMARRVLAQHDEAEVARLRGALSDAADQVAGLESDLGGESAEVTRLRARVEELVRQRDDALVGIVTAKADDELGPVTPLRWGLGDVEADDDGNLMILMSGPDREPYMLELDAERAAALRDELPVAGPASGGYPPALPWAAWLDADDLSALLDAVSDVVVPHAPAGERLTALEEVLAMYRLIAEVDHAQAVVSGPGPDSDGDVLVAVLDAHGVADIPVRGDGRG